MAYKTLIKTMGLMAILTVVAISGTGIAKDDSYGDPYIKCDPSVIGEFPDNSYPLLDGGTDGCIYNVSAYDPTTAESSANYSSCHAWILMHGNNIKENRKHAYAEDPMICEILVDAMLNSRPVSIYVDQKGFIRQVHFTPTPKQEKNVLKLFYNK